MMSLGGVLLNAGNSEAGTWLERALPLHRDAGDEFGEALTLYQLGIAALARGEGERAVALCEAAVAKFRAVGDWWFTIYGLSVLGSAWLTRSERARAKVAFLEGVTLARAEGERWLVHQPLVGLALIASAQGSAQQAVRLLSASEALAIAVGAVTPAPYRALIDRALENARVSLGPARFDAIWRAGQKLSLSEAMDEALGEIDAADPAPVADPDTNPAIRLTARELDVLQLLVQGRSDKAIAAALRVSPRTATTHVTSILGKFGVTSRTAAAALAVRRGLA